MIANPAANHFFFAGWLAHTYKDAIIIEVSHEMRRSATPWQTTLSHEMRRSATPAMATSHCTMRVREKEEEEAARGEESNTFAYSRTELGRALACTLHTETRIG